jgi:hypothetical protein
MKIMFAGDIVGRPGRRILEDSLMPYRQSNGIDLVIANGENAAGGSGLTRKIAFQLFDAGVDIITSGDHIWKKKDIYSFLSETERLVRPLNYPKGSPGRGRTIITRPDGTRVAVINLIGRVFMDAVDCPFKRVAESLEDLREVAPVIIVDMHAEATSEKVAMGYFLDGKVSAVIGTHTHVQTADEKILPGGTAYITDCGMTGPCDSVIGRKKENIIERFVTQLPTRFEVASGDVQVQGVIIEVDPSTGRALGIERIKIKEG